MTEEGTLSIVRRGPGYQVRYASNKPHDQERRPYACPDEAHLAALLHHCGTEVAVIAEVCADVRHGKMAVVLVVGAAAQLQALFPPTHPAHSWQPLPHATALSGGRAKGSPSPWDGAQA